MIFLYIDIWWGPREEFQHLPRGSANINAQKTMFDPYNNLLKATRLRQFPVYNSSVSLELNRFDGLKPLHNLTH